jgi:hypothetical protein
MVVIRGVCECEWKVLDLYVSARTKHGGSTSHSQANEPVSSLDSYIARTLVADNQPKPLPRPCGASLPFKSITLMEGNMQRLHSKTS